MPGRHKRCGECESCKAYAEYQTKQKHEERIANIGKGLLILLLLFAMGACVYKCNKPVKQVGDVSRVKVLSRSSGDIYYFYRSVEYKDGTFGEERYEVTHDEYMRHVNRLK